MAGPPSKIISYPNSRWHSPLPFGLSRLLTAVYVLWGLMRVSLNTTPKVSIFKNSRGNCAAITKRTLREMPS